MSHSIYNYYHSKGKNEKVAFKKKIVEKLDLNVGQLWNWISRDSIPERFKEKYANEIIGKPLSELFPSTD